MHVDDAAWRLIYAHLAYHYKVTDAQIDEMSLQEIYDKLGYLVGLGRINQLKYAK